MSSGIPDHRLNNIDALRLILAVLVLFSHCYPLATGSEQDEPLFVFSRGQLTLGGLAVDCFFILSGYLIVQSWERSRSAGSYMMKRVKRIYPGYLVAVAVCVWVVVPIASPDGFAVFSWHTVLDNSWRFVTLRGFQTPDAFVTNPTPLAVNGSLWSIPFEFWCYIGVLLLGVCGLLRRRRTVLALLLVSIGVHFIVEWQELTPGGKFLGVIFGYPKTWARLLPCYLVGTVLYLYRERLQLDWRWAVVAVIGFVVAARVPHGMVFAVPTFVAYLLIFASYQSTVRWHTASKWGDFSYGIYLYAYPIQQLMMYFIGHPIAPLELFALSLPPTVLAGVASWCLVERWFLRPAAKKTVSVSHADLHRRPDAHK